MAVFRSMTLASILAIALAACAQNPVDPANPDHAAHHPPDTSTVPEDPMARMDAHMQAMQKDMATCRQMMMDRMGPPAARP